IEHVLAPRLIEADGCIVPRLPHGAFASGSEAPRPQEARPGRHRQAMIAQALRQGRLMPAAGIQVYLVPVTGRATSQTANVRLTAAAGRQDALVTKGDVHAALSSPPPTIARRTLFRALCSR